MTPRTYLERGRPVVVLEQWLGKHGPVALPSFVTGRTGKPNAPRNVLIRREDGELVVRSFRGLRKEKQR